MICSECDGTGWTKEGLISLVCSGCDGFGSRMILITKINQPDRGAIVMTHCKICKRSEICVHGLAPKPERGDYWKLEGQCDNFAHVIAQGLRPIPIFEEDPYAVRGH